MLGAPLEDAGTILAAPLEDAGTILAACLLGAPGSAAALAAPSLDRRVARAHCRSRAPAGPSSDRRSLVVRIFSWLIWTDKKVAREYGTTACFTPYCGEMVSLQG